MKGYPTFYKIEGSGAKLLHYLKSGTRGVDVPFMLSVFDDIHAVEDTSSAFKAKIADQKKLLGTERKEARLGKTRLNVQSGKIEELPTPGATTTMKAHIQGTAEHAQRLQAVLDSIEKTKGRKKAIKVQQFIQSTDALPFQKVVPWKTIRERIPIIRRTVKMSLEEELIIDTAVSFVHSLRNDVFLKKEPLSDPETKALKDWLILLSVSLPQEWVLTALVDDVLRNVDELAKNPKLLDGILKGQRVIRSSWSPSCSIIGSGFTCGFWKLLHTVSVGVAEHRGGRTLFTQSFNTFSPAETADVIREFIANFFRCRECAAHFIASYDDCSFERCDRLTDDAGAASDADWKNMATWLWKFHNAVSVRVMYKRGSRNPRLVKDEISVIWPSLQDCPSCYGDDGSWDEDAVFLHLERVYWPGAEIDSRTARLLHFASQIQPPSSVRLYAILCLLVLLVSYRSASPYTKRAIYGPKRSE